MLTLEPSEDNSIVDDQEGDGLDDRQDECVYWQSDDYVGGHNDEIRGSNDCTGGQAPLDAGKDDAGRQCSGYQVSFECYESDPETQRYCRPMYSAPTNPFQLSGAR